MEIVGVFGSYARQMAEEGSDVDILVEISPRFAEKDGFGAIRRLKEIEKELSDTLGIEVDLADRSGLGESGRRHIVSGLLHV